MTNYSTTAPFAGAPRSADAGPNPYMQPPPSINPAGVSPGLAFLLGVIPGVGAIYNGQYLKGFIHVAVLGVLISIVSSGHISGGLEPLFGLLIACWALYMPFEAYHTAQKRQMGIPVDEWSSLLPRAGRSGRIPVGPVILIAIGVLFLLDNLGLLEIDQVLRYWPVILIVVGAYSLYARVSGPGSPPVPPVMPPPMTDGLEAHHE